ncbi:hypothetical protein VNI00_003600 [Paramarasmius palmivorus]|uniref:Ricin B lectin domain-containing protein n=1 Tax=Paramarasmius palmivorus TaxID=297713 RepID=A0AAW0DTM0_9AGAR
MSLRSGYYSILNAMTGLHVALCSNEPGTPLAAQQDDGSDGLKWRFEKNSSGFYRIISRFGGRDSLCANTAFTLHPGIPIFGEPTSGHWHLKPVPSPAERDEIFVITNSGYAWTLKGYEIFLEPLDKTYTDKTQQWTIRKW